VAERNGRARIGRVDSAFEELVGPHRRELLAHCYRLLGSLTDAEDALQETLLAAWRGLDGFEGRSSLRTWLYRIATNRCLNARRRIPPAPAPPFEPPPPTRLGDVPWLQPFPDELLDGIPDGAPGPEARYQMREAVELAFVTGLQRMPPRQAATLILRDVLGYSTEEAASCSTSPRPRSRVCCSGRGRRSPRRPRRPRTRPCPPASPRPSPIATSTPC
jgi:RNA polymerase sigma-70 factor (TIGR02960 family)